MFYQKKLNLNVRLREMCCGSPVFSGCGPGLVVWKTIGNAETTIGRAMIHSQWIHQNGQTIPCSGDHSELIKSFATYRSVTCGQAFLRFERHQAVPGHKWRCPDEFDPSRTADLEASQALTEHSGRVVKHISSKAAGFR